MITTRNQTPHTCGSRTQTHCDTWSTRWSGSAWKQTRSRSWRCSAASRTKLRRWMPAWRKPGNTPAPSHKLYRPPITPSPAKSMTAASKPSRGSTLSASDIGKHYDEFAWAYRRYWGNHIHHGLFLNGDEDPQQAQELM